jgi:hypothetical protein
MKPWFPLTIVGCLLVSSGLGCGDSATASPDNPVGAERPALASGKVPAPYGPSAFLTEKIGHPLWGPVDFHQMTVDISAYAPTYFQALLQQIMSPPNHVWNDALGIGPGAPHPPPYDDEIDHHLADLGFKPGSVFSTAEALWPNVILGLWMVVPSAGAPIGSSPDFEHGAIIPHTIFPIHVNVDFYPHGAANPVAFGSFDVPALDTIEPPINVEGHSHFPIYVGFQWSHPGHHFMDVTMTDNEGNGWEIKQTFVLQETPAPLRARVVTGFEQEDGKIGRRDQ